MDCKHEPAVRTLLRIEVLVIQGLLEGAFLFLVGLAVIPLAPFIVAFGRWSVEGRRGRRRLLTRLLMIPLWFLSGLLFGVIGPFGTLLNSFREVAEVARVEWANRWRTGSPKTPDGHSLRERSAEEQEMWEAAIAMSVVADYNDEARAHGQGLPIDETRL